MVKKKSKTKSVESQSSSKVLATDLYSAAGEFILPNGDLYAGDYCAHRSGLVWREGHGIYQTQDGQTYEGQWHDDKLIEGKEIIITYPNGARYYGPLLKSKYNGAGTYILESNMHVSCDFLANKPSGTVTLIDRDGILWRGAAKENSALLLPENIFYLNLTEDRGKGLQKKPLNDYPMYPSTSTLTNENKEEELSDHEWEKIIFAKSKLTEYNIDFTDCKWWQNYEEFKQKYDEIKTKINDNISLDKEDYTWIERFKKYKKKQQAKKDRKISKWKKEKQQVFALNEKFQSEDFRDSCPPVSVVYPRDVWDDNKSIRSKKIWKEQQGLQSDQLINDSANIIIIGSDDNLVDKHIENIAEALVPKIAPLSADSIESSSSSSENQIVQFTEEHQFDHRDTAITGDANTVYDKVSKHILYDNESGNFELHFTSFREELLLEKHNALNNQEKFEAAKSDQMIKKIESKPDVKGKKSDTTTVRKSELDLEKKNSRIASSVSSVKPSKRSEKVKECVQEFLAERKKKTIAKRKNAMNEKELIHTHDTAAHTESLTGIPRELLLKK